MFCTILRFLEIALENVVLNHHFGTDDGAVLKLPQVMGGGVSQLNDKFNLDLSTKEL